MLFSNALFLALYLLWNWAEYSGLNGLYQVAISSHFPWYVQFSYTPDDVSAAFFDLNFGLAILLLAVLVNLYLAYKLQRSKETKQNPSQNAPTS